MDLPQIVGQSPPWLELLEQISRVAPLDKPVLVIGERGTGKELIAARLHFLSQRWNAPFVKLNCAALPETLLETELFGHEAGAFTGAGKQRLGRFELADGGTLFLDEIANASLAVQEKILRVIEYGEFERVGSSATQSVDVRVIGATHVDLPTAARAGHFREDLLDRLAFDVATVPPLKARGEDIHLLARHFGARMARELELESFAGFAPEVEAELAAYRWPGNVRELRNVVERAVYRQADPEAPIAAVVFDPFASPYRPGRPDPEDAKEAPEEPYDFQARVRDLETDWLGAALARNHHHQRRTAEFLGLTYHQLRGYMRKYDLP